MWGYLECPGDVQHHGGYHDKCGGSVLSTSVHSPTFTCVYVPISRVYPSIPLVNHIRGTVFKLLYINISNDSPYFRCPDERRFYPIEILAFKH